MDALPGFQDPLFGLSQRIPPSNLPAEQALLGALLANNKAYYRVMDFLRAEHFVDLWHARIYREIQRVVDAGGVADVVTLRPAFENEVIETYTRGDDGRLVPKSVLGPYYLAQLLSCMVGIINAAEYAHVIHDCWVRRQLIDAGEVMVNQAFAPMVSEGASGADIAAEIAGQLLSIADPAQAQGTTSIGDAFLDAITAAQLAASGNKPKSLPTGLPKLDQMLGGLRASQLIIIGARPSMGKSIKALTISKAAAQHQITLQRETGEAPGTVLVFSMEMGADEWGGRAAANISGINGTYIRDGQLSQQEWDRLIGARDEALALPIEIDDRPALTVNQIRARARMTAARKKLSLVVVDYLQLMLAEGKAAAENLTTATTLISQGLKRLAKELKVPVVALSQLSRDLERREDKRPTLADLRQSGSLEQDADVVLFLYRDEYYLERNEPKQGPDEDQGDFDGRHATWKASLARVKGKLEVLIAKQRGGPTGTVHARIDGATSRIWQEGDGDE